MSTLSDLTKLAQTKRRAMGIKPGDITTPIPTSKGPFTTHASIQRHEAKRAGCFPSGTRVITNSGINHIQKLTTKETVLSLNSNGNLEWKPIINVYKNGSTNKWIHLQAEFKRGIIVTPNHKIYKKENNKIVLTTIDRLKQGDCIFTHDSKINEDILAILMGGLLGDGCIIKTNKHSFCFSLGSIKKNFINDFSKLFTKKVNIRKKSKAQDFYYFKVRHKILSYLYQQFYPDGTKKIPKNLIKDLTSKSLAIWFMGDGQWSHSKTYLKNNKLGGKSKNLGINPFAGTIYLHTNSFTKEDNELLIKTLNDKFNLKFNLRKRFSKKYNKNYYYLSSSKIIDNQRFFKLISPFLHPDFFYKSPINSGSYIWKNIDDQQTIFPIKIHKIEPYSFKSKGRNGKSYVTKTTRYDIGVKNNHNYFAGGILVSNSHNDLRIDIGGIAYSWAVPKAKMPKPGEKVLAVRTFDHDVDYMRFSGDLPPGYGEGKVNLDFHDKVDVIESNAKKIKFNVYNTGTEVERYNLIKTKGNSWLLANNTKTRQNDPDIPDYKPKYKEKPIEEADVNSESTLWSAKINGAHAAVVLDPGRQIGVYSYRVSKKNPSGMINHTYKIPKLIGKRAPTGMPKIVLRGEVFATDPITGRALAPAEVGGMLNSSTLKSREKQRGYANMRVALFDVHKVGDKLYEHLPYAKKLEVLDTVTKLVPELELPRYAINPKEKTKLLDDLMKGRLKETNEGLVSWKLLSGGSTDAVKLKVKSDYDVVIKDVFAEDSKRSMAGGFHYAHLDNPNKIIGSVGSGFSHIEKRDLLHNFDKNWKGRVAKVRAVEKNKSGALQQPTFVGLHLDYPEAL